MRVKSTLSPWLNFYNQNLPHVFYQEPQPQKLVNKINSKGKIIRYCIVKKCFQEL